MAKLATTAETSIAVTVLAMNLEQCLRALILLFSRLTLGPWRSHGTLAETFFQALSA